MDLEPPKKQFKTPVEALLAMHAAREAARDTPEYKAAQHDMKNATAKDVKVEYGPILDEAGFKAWRAARQQK